MDTLAAYGSSDDDSSSAASATATATARAVATAPAAATANSTASSSSAINQPEPPTKRSRPSSFLPVPSISSQHQPSSLVEWDTDYISDYRHTTTAASNSSNKNAKYLQDRLERSAARLEQFASEVGYATQLKSQHGFHNPCFMENAAQQLGVQQVMTPSAGRTEAFEDYEFNILELEEQVRIQEFQNAQQNQQQ